MNSRRDFIKAGTTAVLGQVAVSNALADGSQKPERNELACGEKLPLPRIKVHHEGHYLETEGGRPFFWLGDTAWQLIHATTREECSYYLHTRSRQEFNVIQTVVLSEFNGIEKPSALGLKPFSGSDPARPNEAYFDRISEIVDEASALGLYIALVATWGDKLTAPWGVGPLLFRNDNLDAARGYASYLARKLRLKTNVMWMLGGDRPARVAGLHNDYLQNIAKQAGFPADQDWTPIWRAFAEGIREGSAFPPLITYHPQGGPESSSQYLQNESWLSVHGMQSGHGGGHDVPVWEWVERDSALTPPRPTLDLEPNYEDHPYNPWPRWDPATGFFRDHDVRKQVYRSVFAGACGVTYGNNSVWGFVGKRNDPVLDVERDWVEALHRPGARQMTFLRELIESRPFFQRIPDQSMIVGDSGKGGQHMQATRDREGSYGFVYIPTRDQEFVIDLSKIRSPEVRAWWFDPRNGVGTLLGLMPTSSAQQFRTPPYGPDWVLALDAPASNYSPPGLLSFAS